MTNLENNILELKKEFDRIKKLNYIKSLRKGTTGVGYTFETLINKKEDTSYLPDYKGIEIKTKLGNSKTAISLLSMVPNMAINNTSPLYYLLDKFGYHKNQSRRFYAKCEYQPKKLIQNKYYFELDIINDLLILNIKNKYKKTISNVIYWNIDELLERAYIKLKNLAFITAYSKTINNNTYYKYKKLDFYELENKEKIIELIKENKIYIEFNIEKKDESKNTFLVHRGATLKIEKEYINELFITK